MIRKLRLSELWSHVMLRRLSGFRRFELKNSSKPRRTARRVTATSNKTNVLMARRHRRPKYTSRQMIYFPSKVIFSKATHFHIFLTAAYSYRISPKQLHFTRQLRSARRPERPPLKAFYIPRNKECRWARGPVNKVAADDRGYDTLLVDQVCCTPSVVMTHEYGHIQGDCRQRKTEILLHITRGVPWKGKVA
jgi:hypothetical protein